MIGNARVSWISKWSTCSWEWMQRGCALSYLDVFPFLLFYLREYYHWIRKEAWIACPLTIQPKSTDLFFSLLHLWTASYYVHDCMLAISHLLGPSSWCPTAMRPSRVGETHSNIFCNQWPTRGWSSGALWWYSGTCDQWIDSCDS